MSATLPPLSHDPAAAAERVRSGDRRYAARLMRDVDDDIPGAWDVLAALHRHAGHAHVVGLTGNPGSGKSTLVSQLIACDRAAGRTVGVIAVDPSSPFSGGAILGDRIRMQRHAVDSGVFIRSVATRGHLGGLSRSTDALVQIMDAMGFDRILLETVGVGQDEIEVVRTAHTSVVVVVPGLGDEVQALKAGILEIADLFVVNKADREGADRCARDLEAMLALGESGPGVHHAGAHNLAAVEALAGGAASAWRPPILMTVASTSQGVEQLCQQIDAHHATLRDSGQLAGKNRARYRDTVVRLARDQAWQRVLERAGGASALEAIVDRLCDHSSDPYTEARRLVAQDGGRATE